MTWSRKIVLRQRSKVDLSDYACAAEVGATTQMKTGYFKHFASATNSFLQLSAVIAVSVSAAGAQISDGVPEHTCNAAIKVVDRAGADRPYSVVLFQPVGNRDKVNLAR